MVSQSEPRDQLDNFYRDVSPFISGSRLRSCFTSARQKRQSGDVGPAPFASISDGQNEPNSCWIQKERMSLDFCRDPPSSRQPLCPGTCVRRKMLSKIFSRHVTAILSLLAHSVSTRNVPQNVRDLYNSLQSNSGCSNKLATGFMSRSGGSNGISCFPFFFFFW